ncbi:MAG: asparaginase [Deltaproteobacteria bacterium]|nr:asparaginase [Deltaproteobacteria bacterium]
MRMTSDASCARSASRSICANGSSSMSNILMIHTGGTLMMRPGRDSSTLEPADYARDLVAELPILKTVGKIDTRILFNLDSGDMQPHHWVALAELIHNEIQSYDGVVVVHGTDVMAYTASALTFLLPGLDRPVVLTGSQRPLFEIRTDARVNLVDACHIATLAVPEVGIAFASKFLRGCRATKLDAWGFDAFASPLCQPLVELGLGAILAPHVLQPRAAGAFDPRIDSNVLSVRLFPGLNPDLLRHSIDSGVHGIVLEAYGAGNVPHLERSFIPAIARATQAQVPVVIVSQCPRGATELQLYPGAAAASEAGAISGGDMTIEAALTKLMVTLGRAPAGKVLEFVASAFRRPLLGEMSRDLPFR